MFAFQGDNFLFDTIAGEKAISEKLSLDTAKAPLSIDVMVNEHEICYIISAIINGCKDCFIFIDITSRHESKCRCKQGIQGNLLVGAEADSFAEISRAYGIKADIMFAFQGDNFLFDTIAGEKAISEKLSLDTAKAPLYFL